MSVEIKQYEHILLHRDGNVATLSLNRPDQLNALYSAVFEEIGDALAVLDADPAVRAVVLTGEGRAFCAGGDIKLDVSQVGVWDARETLAETRRCHRIIVGLAELSKPVIARVNGVAVGGGCDLALACDIVIASEEASFGALWIRRGLTPGMGSTWLLPRLIGPHRAKQFLFSGELMDARTAADIGMINAAVPAADLDREVGDLAHRLASMPTLAIGVTKRLVDSASGVSLRDHLQSTVFTSNFAAQTGDYVEGVAAFTEKREPEFEGR